MKSLTETLISILERERGGLVVAPEISIPAATPTAERYPVGTVFFRKGVHSVSDKAAILVRSNMNQCVLVCLPSGNRWSDDHTFKIKTEHPGPTKEEFHIEFGDEWNVSRRGKEALEEWARTDV